MSVMQTRRGMTLIEIMFAFAILTTILMVAYTSALNAYRSAVVSNQRTQAQGLAQQQIEQLKALRGQSSPHFNWYTNLGGANNFLQQVIGGPQPSPFVVVPCDVSSPGSCGAWEVMTDAVPRPAPAAGSAIGANDATDFKVAMVVTECYGATGKLTFCPPGDLNTVQSVGVQISVSWLSATGIPSSLTENTILTKPGDGS